MKTVGIKKGVTPKINYKSIDSDGLLVPAKTKRKIYNVRQNAYQWAKRNGVKFSCEQREDPKTGKKVGVMIYLVG
jgi:hypothetical protein